MLFRSTCFVGPQFQVAFPVVKPRRRPSVGVHVVADAFSRDVVTFREAAERGGMRALQVGFACETKAILVRVPNTFLQSVVPDIGIPIAVTSSELRVQMDRLLDTDCVANDRRITLGVLLTDVAPAKEDVAGTIDLHHLPLLVHDVVAAFTLSSERVAHRKLTVDARPAFF